MSKMPMKNATGGYYLKWWERFNLCGEPRFFKWNLDLDDKISIPDNSRENL